jgi:hypothetical protein
MQSKRCPQSMMSPHPAPLTQPRHAQRNQSLTHTFTGIRGHALLAMQRLGHVANSARSSSKTNARVPAILPRIRTTHPDEPALRLPCCCVLLPAPPGIALLGRGASTVQPRPCLVELEVMAVCVDVLPRLSSPLGSRQVHVELRGQRLGHLHGRTCCVSVTHTPASIITPPHDDSLPPHPTPPHDNSLVT